MSAAVPMEKSLIDGDAGIRGVIGALLFVLLLSAAADERWDKRRMSELIVLPLVFVVS